MVFLSFLPAGRRRCAPAGRGHRVRHLDLQPLDGKRTRFLQGHEAAVTALGVSPDGKWLVSGSVDQSIRLWAIKDFDRVIEFGAARAELKNGKLGVSSVTSKGASPRARAARRQTRSRKPASTR